MTKKKRKNITEQPVENDSVETKAGLNETSPVESEAPTASGAVEEVAQSASESAAADEISMDDLLDDVRQSLIEDESQSDAKKSGWWGRLSKGRQKDQEPEVEIASEPIPFPEPEVETTIVAEEKQPPKDEYLDQIDELIDMLDTPTETAQPTMEPVIVEEEPQPTPEPEASIDLDELKKRAFSTRGDEKVEESLSEVRTIALEGGEEVFVEVESKKEDPNQERLRAFENVLKPYRRYIYFATAFLGLVVAVVILALMVRTLANNNQLPFLQKEVVPTEVSNLPYPTALNLPGGLNFSLGKGVIKDGSWNPTGPEWLQGTEICRWVAIPWSRQLEAVVRTLTQEDTIELVMSNNDTLTYHVSAIDELTLAEMQKLDSNSPCLLLVLAEQDSEKRWVVTALP